MSSEQYRGIGFDAAYQTVTDEIFGDHPLTPAFYMSYLEHDLFSRLTDDTQYDITPDERFHSWHDQKELFWATFHEIYNMGVEQYKAWVGLLDHHFNELIITAIEAKKGDKKALSQFYQAAHEAVIRDYEYFGVTDVARNLGERGLSEGDPQKIVRDEINNLAKNLEPKNDKAGYSLARRLCNKERPLLLKFLCDQIKATTWYVKHQHGLNLLSQYIHIPLKYRLFCSANELTAVEQTFDRNCQGASEGQHGSTIGNKFLTGEVGHVLLGAIHNSLTAETTHDGDVQLFLDLAFYNDWDSWLSRYIADMVHHDSPSPGDRPEFQVIANYSRHFVNIGTFVDNQPMSHRAFAIISRLCNEIQQWPDADILSKVALKAMGDSKTGSGRSGNRNTSKVPDPADADKIAVEEPPPGHSRGHVEETQQFTWGGSDPMWSQGFGM